MESRSAVLMRVTVRPGGRGDKRNGVSAAVDQAGASTSRSRPWPSVRILPG